MLPIWGMVDWLFCFELSTNLPWSHPSDRCHSIPSQHHLCVLQGSAVETGYLVYKNPLSYADLILNGDPEKYLKKVAGHHGLEY